MLTNGFHLPTTSRFPTRRAAQELLDGRRDPLHYSVRIEHYDTRIGNAAWFPAVRPHYAARRAHCPWYRAFGSCPDELGHNGRRSVAYRTLRDPRQPDVDLGCASSGRS